MSLENKKAIVTMVINIGYSILFVVLLIVYSNISSSFSVFGLGAYINDNNVSDYLTVLSIQFTTVFLTTGLMSMLGAEKRLIYHIDIVERVLLTPTGWSFKSISIYAFTTLFWSVVAFILRASYLVILATATGIVLVSLLFFKMMDIYFDREKKKHQIKEELKSERISYDDYKKRLNKLLLVIQNNIEEKQKEPLLENITMLIELYVYYNQKEGKVDEFSYIMAKTYEDKIPVNKTEYTLCVLDKVIEEVEENSDYSVVDICSKISEYFKQEIYDNRRRREDEEILNLCKIYSVELMVNYLHKDNNGNNCIGYLENTIYEIPEHFKYLLEICIEKIRGLRKSDYQNEDIFSEGSLFLQLAEKILKTRVYLSDCDISKSVLDGFYEDISELIKKDEQRIRDVEVELYHESDYLEKGMSGYFLDEENYNGCFVRILPKLALKYTGDNACRVLEAFYYTYKYSVCEEDINKLVKYYKAFNAYSDEEYYDMRYYYPRENYEGIYENMMCMFFQGCAQMIMSGKGGVIIKTVVELVFDFWKTAQFYKEPEQLQTFYKKTFNCFGSRLLYTDTSCGNEGFNEHPEDVLKFIEMLVYKCKKNDMVVPERVYKFDAEIVFEDFLSNLKGASPQYYSEEIVGRIKRIAK